MMPALACFELLGLTPAFDLDEKALEAAYFQQQRQYHPDRFVGRPQEEREKALQRSVDVNEAYRTLKEPLSRAQLLLAMQGVIVGTDNDTVKPSQQLLMDSMEWREAVDEADTPPAAQGQAVALYGYYTDCLGRISRLYGSGDYTAMAQETLRLGYILKAHEAALQKVKRLQKTAP